MAEPVHERVRALLVRLGFDLAEVLAPTGVEGFCVLGLHPDRLWACKQGDGSTSFMRWPADVRDEAWAAMRADAVDGYGEGSREVVQLDHAMSSLKPEED